MNVQRPASPAEWHKSMSVRALYDRRCYMEKIIGEFNGQLKDIKEELFLRLQAQPVGFQFTTNGGLKYEIFDHAQDKVMAKMIFPMMQTQVRNFDNKDWVWW